jgi:hypothetical protein
MTSASGDQRTVVFCQKPQQILHGCLMILLARQVFLQV